MIVQFDTLQNSLVSKELDLQFKMCNPKQKFMSDPDPILVEIDKIDLMEFITKLIKKGYRN